MRHIIVSSLAVSVIVPFAMFDAMFERVPVLNLIFRGLRVCLITAMALVFMIIALGDAAKMKEYVADMNEIVRHGWANFGTGQINP